MVGGDVLEIGGVIIVGKGVVYVVIGGYGFG